MLRLHDYDETIFDKGCIAYLGNAVEVRLEKKINDIECLYFEYPYLDEKAAMIEENMIVSCEGQGYVILKNTRKTDGKDMKSVTAADLFSTYGKTKFIENIPDMIGKKPSAVFKKILEGSQFTAFTEAELNERGMTWVDSDGYLIDFFSLDKTNVWDATKTLIENCGKGEIYHDNFKVAIVQRIGKDNGVRLTLEKNLDGLEIMQDMEHVITRLYPYGADDMHIGSVNNGLHYIDSPNIEKYGIREGYKDYSDYTDPEKIKAHAEWEFNPENEDRIDVPKVNITGGFIELFKLPEVGDIERVDIGDTVRVYDNDHNMYKRRIVAYSTYPYEPKAPTIEIGHLETNFFSIIYNLSHRRKQLEKVQTTNNQIATRSLAGVVNTDRNGVHSDNELLKIVGDLLTIYNNSGKKRLELGNVGGQFALNIYDETGKLLKIKLGDYGDKYAFAIYDNNGDPAIYMDENGEIITAGKITSHKSAELYNGLTLGAAADGSIKFQGPVTTEGSISVVDHEMDINANYVRINDRDILAEIDEIKEMLLK